MLKKIKAEAYAPINNACLLILAGTALTWILIYAKTVLMPFVIAVFFYIVLNTIAVWIQKRWQIPHLLGVILGVFLFLGVAGLSIAFVSTSISSFVEGANTYTDKLHDTIAWVLHNASKIGIKINSEFIADTINKLPLLNMAKSMGGGVVSFVSNTMLVCLFLIFLFMGGSSDEKTSLASTIEQQISYYLIIKILVSLLAAAVTWIILTVVGTELAFMFAVLTFVLNFIPNIGPFIATALPAPVLFLQYGLDWHIIVALSLLIAAHFVIGNILETKWLGKGMDLNPVVVIASLIFWALVWGAVGALLAVPLTSIIKMILERSEPTKPFADLLAGRLPFK
ncbi:MAG: AI-2E family transporter [Elusimicrobiaceae bacterium]|nr:AI-2E family transporter [Elusimicrobiaceae bacterium]